jgi:excisionase family DNA binding protein
MKNDQLKDVLIRTLQHIQQTNELLSSIISIIKDMEDEPRAVVPAATKEEYPEHLSVDKAAQFTGYSRSYIYRLIHLGRIPCYKPNGGRLFFKKSELEEFLLSGKKASSYELSNQADEILNSRKPKRPQSRPKNGKGKHRTYTPVPEQ